MRMQEENQKEIEEFIEDKDSPVGIDAKKAHIFIIQKLLEIEKRLKSLESK